MGVSGYTIFIHSIFMPYYLYLSTKTFPIMSLRDHFIHCSPTHPLGHQSLVSLFSNDEVDIFSLGKRNPYFVAFANNKNVGEPGGKVVAIGIFHRNHIKRTSVSLSVGDHTSSSQVSTSGHQTQGTSVKLEEVGGLPLSKPI